MNKIKSLWAENPFKLLFIVTISVYYILIPIMSLDMGINADERWQVKLSEYGLDFYMTLGKDTTIMRSQEDVAELKKKLGEEKVKELRLDRNVFEGGGLKYYGGLYEITVGIINRIAGHPNDMDPVHHDIRHFFLALFGCTIMLLTGLVAKEIFGWRAAWLAIVLIFISPVFLGHSMMNPKDIPYAFGNMLTTLFLVRYIKDFKDPARGVLIGLILGIAATLNVRPGGLLLIIYFIFFTAIAVAYYQFLKKDSLNNAGFIKILKNILIVTIPGYFLGLIFWPFGLVDPIHHPLEGIDYISKISVNIRQLFEGEQIFSNQLPWYYLSKYLVITNPVVVLTGLTLFLALLFFKRKEIPWAAVGILVFTIAFPLLYIIYKKANVYSGWRHVLFVYPPLVVLAAGGWEILMQLIKSKYAKIGVGTMIAVMSFFPLKWIITNHPYEYIFFNPIVGGTNEAYKNYVTDYWMLSIREASDWLIKNELEKNPGKKIIVGTNCTYPTQVYLSHLSDNVEVHYVRYYEKSQRDWDYGLFYVDYVSPHQLKNNFYPPDKTVHTVMAGGAPLCAVIKRDDKSDFEGYEALNAGNYPLAVEKFRQAAQAYPKSEAVFTGLGMAYLNTGNFENAIGAFNKSVQLYPDNAMTLYYLGIAYAQKGDFNYAIFYLEKTIKANPGMKQAYQVLGNIYQQKGDNATAKRYLDFAGRL